MMTTEYTSQEMMLFSNRLEVPRAAYQRRFRSKRARLIAEFFDERLANPLKVSFRDGRYRVFDGQHTMAARIMLNGGKHLPIKCIVYMGLTEQDEAALFAQQAGFSAPLTAGEYLRAQICAREYESAAFQNACNALDLQLDFDQKRGEFRIGCIKTAFEAYRRIGEEQFTEAMRILIAACNGDPDSLCAANVSAITHFVELYHGEYDPHRLATRLGHVDPLTIYHEGQIAGASLRGYKKYLYQIYRIYNGSSKTNKLPLKF